MAGPLRRVLGLWITATVIAGVVASATVAPREDAVTATGTPARTPSTTWSVSDLALAAPEGPTTTSSTAPTTTAPPRSTTTATAPATGGTPRPSAPAVPLADRPGIWVVEPAARAARRIGDSTAACSRHSELLWRRGSASLLYQGDETGRLRELGLDGSVRLRGDSVIAFDRSPQSDRAAVRTIGPHGQVIRVTDGDLASNPVVYELPGPYEYAHPGFDREGTRVALVTAQHLAVLGSGGQLLQTWRPHGVTIEAGTSPTWTTDGRWVVFGLDPVYAVRADGTDVHELDGLTNVGRSPGPGSLLSGTYFDRSGEPSVALVDVASGRTTVLRRDAHANAWSPRGGLIAWSGWGGAHPPGVHSMTADGTAGPDLLRVASFTTTEGSASWESHHDVTSLAWSPDQRLLAAVVC